ncbi:Origin recognition complex subunit 3 [Malassezia sp. CBS 17886]|nr:Origin recognition complex subunit 3 [Malassezia sp. CBS 17886]
MASDAGLLDAEPISVTPFIPVDAGLAPAPPVFPPIAAVEKDGVPGQMRHTAFTACWESAYAQLQRHAWDVHRPALAALHAFAKGAHHGDLVPVAAVDASAGAANEALPGWIAHALTSPTPPGDWQANAEGSVRDGAPAALCATVGVAQCANLSEALAAFISDVLQQGAAVWDQQAASSGASPAAEYDDMRASLHALCHQYEDCDLDVLAAWMDAAFGRGTRPVLHLLVQSPERFGAAVLNDFLSALLVWTRSRTAPRAFPLRITLVYTAPLPLLPREKNAPEVHTATSWLNAVLQVSVLRHTDVVPCTFPDKTQFWERVVCRFLLEPDAGIWLGRSVLEMIRRRYWHVEASLEGVAQCIRLCYWQHFSSCAYSAFVQDASVSAEEVAAHWTPDLVAGMRLALFSPFADGAATRIAAPAVHQAAADNDGALLGSLPHIHKQCTSSYTHRVVVMGIVEALLTHLSMSGMHGTKLGYTSCLANALELDPPYSDWNKGHTAAFAYTTTMPTERQQRHILQHLAGTLPADEVARLLDRLVARLDCERDAGAPWIQTSVVDRALEEIAELQLARPAKRARPHAGGDAAGALHERFSGWVSRVWSRMISTTPSDLAAAIWTYDFAEPVATAIEGAGRAAVLMALDTPSDALASMCAAGATASGQREQEASSDWPELREAMSEVDVLRAVRRRLAWAPAPDICRAYALYKESAKFINLSDWYDTFAYSIEKERHAVAQRGGASAPRACDGAVEAWSPSLQTRFSLAVNELAQMGLLAPTGRKPEHLLRTIWDLPMAEQPDA